MNWHRETGNTGINTQGEISNTWRGWRQSQEQVKQIRVWHPMLCIFRWLHWKQCARQKQLHFGASYSGKKKEPMFVCVFINSILYIYLLTLFANWYVTCINAKIKCKTGNLPWMTGRHWMYWSPRCWNTWILQCIHNKTFKLKAQVKFMITTCTCTTTQCVD
jgi:hypothetical protein